MNWKDAPKAMLKYVASEALIRKANPMQPGDEYAYRGYTIRRSSGDYLVGKDGKYFRVEQSEAEARATVEFCADGDVQQAEGK